MASVRRTQNEKHLWLGPTAVTLLQELVREMRSVSITYEDDGILFCRLHAREDNFIEVHWAHIIGHAARIITRIYCTPRRLGAWVNEA